MTAVATEQAPSTVALTEVPHLVIERMPVEHRNIDVVERFDESYIGNAPTIIAKEFADVWQRTHAIESTGEVFDSAVSAHQVAFARLKGRRPAPTNSVAEKSLCSVAIKQEGSRDAALHELRGYTRLIDLGVETFEPVALVENDNGAFVVTKRRNDIGSLEQDSWIRGMEPTDEQEALTLEVNLTTVKEISAIFAWIHLNGMFHPDGQIKNWITTSERKVGIIDPENHVQLDIGNPDTGEKMWDDILKFYKSLRQSVADPAGLYGVGLLHGLPEKMLIHMFDELTIQPYQDALIEGLEKIEHDVDSDEFEKYVTQASALLDSLMSYEDRIQEVMCVN